MKQLFFAALIIAIILSCHRTEAQPYQVGHITATFIDSSRSNRAVATEIYYPSSAAGDNVPFATSITGPVPCISFGHGFVMTYDAYTNIRDAVVAAGYIIAFPTTEGSFSPSHATFGQDLAFVLRKLQQLGNSPSSLLFNKVDTMNCVMGHSMGGGASFLAAAADPTIKGIITFAPAETTPSAITAASAITVPALVFAGSNDCVTPPADNQLPMYNALSASCKHYISITGGSHCQMANSSLTCDFGEATCTPAPAITRAAQHDIMDTYLISWLDYRLKGLCTAGSFFDGSLASGVGITSQKTCDLCSTTSAQAAISTTAPAVYPNPCTDQLTIHRGDKPYNTVRVYSISGIKILDIPMERTKVIPVSALAPGNYYYELQGVGLPPFRAPFVVMR